MKRATRPMHILLIEDELGLCRLPRRALEASRLVVDVAVEGEVGLVAALGGDYDLIILDLDLPDIDGQEVCQRLRAAGNGTPVLMLTDPDEVEDRVAGLDAGG
jgi:DNA-binding response OmpR family regulator